MSGLWSDYKPSWHRRQTEHEAEVSHRQKEGAGELPPCCRHPQSLASILDPRKEPSQRIPVVGHSLLQPTWRQHQSPQTYRNGLLIPLKSGESNWKWVFLPKASFCHPCCSIANMGRFINLFFCLPQLSTTTFTHKSKIKPKKRLGL